MKILNSFMIYITMILILSCNHEKRSNIKETIKESFFNWAQHMPSVDDFDTIYSNKKIQVEHYNITYIPNGLNLVGKIMTVGNEKMDKMNYFIIYLKEEEKLKKYYLEIFNINGEMFYKKEIFDFDFLKKDCNNFCKFYRDRDNEKYIFENYSDTLLVKRVKLDYKKILELKNMI